MLNMPRPDSGVLSGVLAGINQFKQTKQFYEQMEVSGLQKEASRAQLDAFQRREQDYESPGDIRAGRIQDQLDTEETIYQRGIDRQPLEDERKMALYEEQLRLGQKYAPPRGTEKPLITYKDAMKTLEGYAMSEGVDIPGGIVGISPGIIDEAMDEIMAGRSGDAIALIKADKYTKLPEAAWLAELPPKFAPHIKEYLINIAKVAATEDDVLDGLADLRRQFADKGYIDPKTDWLATIQQALKGEPGSDPIKNINKGMGDFFRRLGVKGKTPKQSQSTLAPRIESRP